MMSSIYRAKRLAGMVFLLVGALSVGRASEDDDACYVESTADTYVESDYCPNPDTRIEVNFRFLETTKQSRVFGVAAPSSLSSSLYINTNNRITFVHKDGSASGTQSKRAPDTDRYTAILDSPNSKFYLVSDGPTTNINADITTTRTKQGQYPIFFFGENRPESKETSEMKARMRFYGCKIYEKGELVRDYVPCVRNGFVGIKDQLTGAFFFPKDYNPLTAGPGTLRETTTDGYLESTGSDQLDTGYKPTPNTRIEADFEMTSVDRGGKYPRVFGSDGLRYELYLSGAENFSYSAFDSVSGPNTGAGYQTSTGYKADVGVRHLLYLDHYRMRVAFATPDATALAGVGPLKTVMTNATLASKSIYIFGTSSGNGMDSKARLYGYRIYESDVLVRDYVPYVKDYASGLYDRVTGEFLNYACGSTGGDVMVDGTEACLVSDGTQGIVSDYFATPGSKIVVDFSFNEVATKQQRLFASESDGDVTHVFSCQTYLNGSGCFAYSFCDGEANYTKLQGEKPVAGTRYVMTLDGPNGKVSVTGGAIDILEDITTIRTKTATYPLGIFMNYNKADFTNKGGNIRLYSLKCYDDGVLVHQYLPYKSGDTVGLYDTVTGKVFVNTKSGANPFRIDGMGTDGSGSALLVKPKDAWAEWGSPAVLKAFAPGAIAYRWFEGDTEITGETGAELAVARQTGRKLVTYSVKPVFMVNGRQIEGEAASATVKHRPLGMLIQLK